MTESEFQEFIITIGYRYNEKTKTAFNSFEGFHALIRFSEQENRYALTMSAGANNSADAAEAVKRIKEFYEEHKNYIIKAEFKKRSINIYVKMTVDSQTDKEELKEAARFIIELCKSEKIVPVCKVCGRHRETGVYIIGKEMCAVCSRCINRKRRQYVHRRNVFEKKKQNMPAGIVGALFGGALGAAVYILIYQLLPTYGAAAAAIVVLSYMGFVVTGSRATKKSAVICTALSVVIFVLAEYAAVVANMAIIIERNGGGIAVSEAITVINNSIFVDGSYLVPILVDLGVGVGVMIVVGVAYFLKRKYTRPLKISDNLL